MPARPTARRQPAHGDPITNVALAIKEIFKGTIDMSFLIVIFVSTAIMAGILLSMCNWWFQREQVLFRS